MDLKSYETFNLSADPIDFSTTISCASNNLSRYDGRGNLSSRCTEPSIVQIISGWQWNGVRTNAPVCMSELSHP
eukprot:10228790-Karenia_brevis.AAC.1